MQLTPALSLGLGINAPFGLKTEYDSNWIGRFHAIKSEVRTINVNPSIAFKVNDQISLGAGSELSAYRCGTVECGRLQHDHCRAGLEQRHPDSGARGDREGRSRRYRLGIQPRCDLPGFSVDPYRCRLPFEGQVQPDGRRDFQPSGQCQRDRQRHHGRRDPERPDQGRHRTAGCGDDQRLSEAVGPVGDDGRRLVDRLGEDSADCRSSARMARC